jgi:hypothetical protein
MIGFSRPKSRERIETILERIASLHGSRFSRPKSRERIETRLYEWDARRRAFLPAEKPGAD